jgi:hypothetical protein
MWETLVVGGPIEIVHVGTDPAPYHRGGIFASNGNFAFDVVFLAILLSVAWATLRPRGTTRRRRGAA